MIIADAFLQFIHPEGEGGGVDAKGHPLRRTPVYGPAVYCQMLPRSVDRTARSMQGEAFTRQSYELLVEQPLPRGVVPSGQLRLTARGGREIGEFPVLAMEPLDAVCQIRILI